MPTVLIINGPNLNLLGTREPELYGRTTLKDIEQDCQQEAESCGLQVQSVQSNFEGEIVETIQAARGTTAGIIINAAAYSHSSIAILDALNAYEGKVIEVHLSNIHQREGFRHHSYVSRRAEGVIVGLGALGYRLALQAMKNLLVPNT